MPVYLRVGAALASIAVLLVPAFWNHFPLLQYDTGGYLALWYEGYLAISRSAVYGLFLNALTHPDFWPVVIAQAGLTVWVLSLVMRSLGFGRRPMLLFIVIAALSVVTTLPWLTSIMLTDIFAGLALLIVYLLVFADDVLRRWERNALFVLLAFSVATHSATFAVIAGLAIAAALAWWLFRIGFVSGIVRSAAAVVLAAGLLVSANFVVSGHFVWTPGGMALSFGRMLQDGIVARYLAEHCPVKRFRLCAHQKELPTDADVFFWGNSIFEKLGRFDGLGDEMSTIVVESLRDYPILQLETALESTAEQLVKVGTGEGIVDSAWHTYWVVDTFLPSIAPDMHDARQQHNEFGFAAINRLHEPVALGSMVLLFATILLGWRLEAFAQLGLLAATTAVTLLGNAVVCGVLANPHDRYGARLIWIAPFVIMLTLYRLYLERASLRNTWGRVGAAAQHAPRA
jgi:hypothetical protein